MTKRIRLKSKLSEGNADDKIGRGKPPKNSQFKPGESGNRKGRPKGSRNLATLMMQAANDSVTANISGKQRKISKLHATTMQLATKAAGGDPKMIGQFLDWVDQIESRAAAARPSEYPLSNADIEVIKAVHTRLYEHLGDTN